MKMPLFRAALTTAVAVVVALPAAASAASLTIDDATGDTYLATYDEATDTESFEPAGSQVNVDLDKTVVKHKSGAVVVKAKYAELKRDDKVIFFGVELRTDEGLKRETGVFTFARAKGDSYMATGSGMKDVKCPGLAHEIDYAADLLSLTIPRSCLSRPKWVQARVGSVGLEDSQSNDAYVDNGHNATSNEPKTWSDKVRRG